MKSVRPTESTKIVITLRFCFLVYLLLPIRHVFSQCSATQWLCDNQVTCIDEEEKCDGPQDCPDGSDETAVNCFNATTCPDFSFQCNYGACIAGSKRCNGISDCGDKSDELLCNENVKLENLQGDCRSNDEMQCLKSKECIDISDICDGQMNCSDGTDETLELCGRELCPTGFRCAYGGCISGNARCNGTAECHDKSDEAWDNCGYKRKFTQTPEIFPARSPATPADASMSCKIPDGSTAVVITLLHSDVQLAPGSVVNDDETVQAKCANLKDDDGRDLLCLEGKWQGKFPTCSVFCDNTFLKGISTSYVCHQNGIHDKAWCNPSILPNTIIDVFCATGYKRTPSRVQKLLCLEDGKLNEQRLPCEQYCGKLTPAHSVSLTKHGFPIIPSDAPWHVAIFRNDNGEQIQICGGSIISPRLIITAAHCFWNKTVPTSPHLYRIIAGKQNNMYIRDSKEGETQDIEVEKIHISEEYEDQQNHFYADVALLKLKTFVIYNENVSSLCMYNPEGNVQDYVKSNLIGSITGYGRSGTLERLNMGTLSNEECQRLDDGGALASDKFCLRNKNSNATLCRGDSGGGFVELHNGAFYLLGIVSFTPVTSFDCVTAQFIGMSNVRYMRPDLRDVWQREIKNDQELF